MTKLNHEAQGRYVCIGIGLGVWDQLFNYHEDHRTLPQKRGRRQDSCHGPTTTAPRRAPMGSTIADMDPQ